MCTASPSGGGGPPTIAVAPPPSADWTATVIRPMTEQWVGMPEGRVVPGPTMDSINPYNSFGYPRAKGDSPGVMHPDLAPFNPDNLQILQKPLVGRGAFAIPLAPRWR